MGPGVSPGYDNIPETAGNEECRALNTIRRGWQTGQEGRKVLGVRNTEGEEETHYSLQMHERDDQIRAIVREGKTQSNGWLWMYDHDVQWTMLI